MTLPEEVEMLRAALADCLLELKTYGCDEQGEYMHTVRETINRTEKILNQTLDK